MHLRPHQREQLEVTLENLGLELGDDLVWEKPTSHLPQALSKPGLLKGVSLLHRPTGYFFTLGEPWISCWSPDGSNQYSEVRTDGDFATVAGRFKGWAEHLKEELDSPRLWPASSEPESAAKCLQLSQLNELYRVLRKAEFPEVFVWSGNDHSARLQVKGLQFFFKLQRLQPTSGRGPFAVAYSPGSQTIQDSSSGVNWKQVVQLFNQWIDNLVVDLPAEQRLRAPRPKSAERTQLKSIYLRKIELYGIRQFKNFTAEFFSGCQDVLVIGGNGTGKSTLLRSLALLLMPLSEAQQLAPSPGCDLLSDDSDQGTISATFMDELGLKTVRTLRITRTEDGELLEPEFDEAHLPPVVGFGSGRGVVGATDQTSPTAASLFKYETQLISVEIVLNRLEKRLGHSEVYKALLDAIVNVVAPESGLSFHFSDQGLMLVRNGRQFPYSAWADGFRLTTAIVVNILARALLWEQDFSDFFSDGKFGVRGVLLIDEVEQHLHPKLQYSLMRHLRATFPNLLIVCTTHSPVVLLGVQPESVLSLKIDAEGSVVAQPVPNFENSSILEIVESISLFDAPVYSPELEAKLERHRQLTRLRIERGLSSDEQNEIKELARELIIRPK